MDWIWILLGVLFLLNTIQLRSFLSSLKLVGKGKREKESFDIHFYQTTEDEFSIDEKHGVMDFMEDKNIKILDLIPEYMNTSDLIDFANSIKSHKDKSHRFDTGLTAGYATAVDSDVVARAGWNETTPLDSKALAELVKTVKNYAVTSMDYGIAPDTKQPPQKKEIGIRKAMKLVLYIKLPIMSLVLAGPFISPLYGGIVIILFHIQPLLAIFGTKLHPKDLFIYSLFRLPIEIYRNIYLLFNASQDTSEKEKNDALRPIYEKLLQTNPSDFFEKRKEQCPLCQSSKLISWIKTSDLLQNKPGKFFLEKCKNCGHIFQNPRLSLKGLDFYYKDFYDGLGKESTSFVFGTMAQEYKNRADYFKQHLKEIDSWLDVGLGQGHFCNVARDIWPNTRFDGLDFSECVAEAKQRGWIDRGYHGLFPELAHTFPEQYKVVSMFHYLEHTLDPRIELKAAHAALSPQGYLIIESPNPESVMGKIIGKYWLTWFQPQHLNFMSTKNLEKILNDIGFSKVSCQFSQMHRRVDFSSALWIFINWVAPQSDKPWRKTTVIGKVWRAVVSILSIPCLILFRIIDLVTFPLNRGKYLSNTFRFVAQKI